MQTHQFSIRPTLDSRSRTSKSAKSHVAKITSTVMFQSPFRLSNNPKIERKTITQNTICKTLDYSANEDSYCQPLKFTIKQLEQQLLEKHRELDRLKKDARTTKLQELQILVEEYKTEIQRLCGFIRNQLQYNQKLTVNSPQCVFSQQQEQISNLKTQIQTLTNLNQELLKKNQNYQAQIESYRSQLEQIKLKQSYIDSQNRGTSRSKSVHGQQSEYCYKNSGQQSESDKHEEPQQPNKVKQQQMMLKQISMIARSKQDPQFQDQETTCISSQQAQYKIAVQETLDQKVQKSMNLLKLQIERENQPQIVISQPLPVLMKKSSVMLDRLSVAAKDDIEDNQHNSSFSLFPSQEGEITRSSKKLRLPRVNQYDVAKIGLKLKLKFQTQKLPLSEVEETFDDYSEDCIAIHQLLLIFQMEPFCITDDKERMLLARYLIEDNSNDYSTYDTNLEADLAIVKSVFRSLLQRYRLFDNEEEQLITSQLKQIFTQHGSKIHDLVQISMTNKNRNHANGICDITDFQSVLRTLDIQLKNRQMEYMQLKSFKHGIDVVNYRQFF